VVERLTGHRSRREKCGGAKTTGTVTIENPTPAGWWRRTEPGSTNPPSLRDGTCGARRSGGVRAATSCSMTLVSREALDHRLMAPTASGVVRVRTPDRAFGGRVRVASPSLRSSHAIHPARKAAGLQRKPLAYNANRRTSREIGELPWKSANFRGNRRTSAETGELPRKSANSRGNRPTVVNIRRTAAEIGELPWKSANFRGNRRTSAEIGQLP